ncbi:MAG: 2OG-Fe(II) oxygenase family protein [Patescibacteria group bacterium]
MKNIEIAKDAAELSQLLARDGCGLYTSSLSGLSLQALQPIIDTFMDLINLPKEERAEWEIDADGEDNPDDGLVERFGGGYDHKFFFHFKSMERIMHTMSGKQSYANQRDKWDKFLMGLEMIHARLCQDLLQVISAFDGLYPGHDMLEKIKQRNYQTRGIIRLLYYKPGHAVTAKPHYDQSLLTAHVAESRPGLIVGKENHEAGIVYVPDNRNMLVFPGIKADIATDNVMQAMYHVAVADETKIDEGRWAIIFFYNCEVPFTTKELSAKIQEKLAKA